ncbi:MAG TPA: choice-of-anchor tandem repeat NxxGxxAF-containing protein [Rhodopila sp.]
MTRWLVGGLLLRGALARVQLAVGASLVLWTCVLWATLSQPVPPKRDDPPPPSPPSLRRIVGTGQATPIGGTFDRFDVASQPIVAPVNASGQVAFYATILRNKATEGLFLARGGKIMKLAAVGDSVPGGGVLTQFAKHPMPSLNDAGTVAFGAAVSAAQAAEGIFVVKDGSLKVIAMVGSDAPGVVGGTFVEFDTPSLNNRDEIVFVSTIRHGRDTFEALYLYSNGRLRKLLTEGDPYLGGGFFDQFGLPAINNRGVIAVPVTLNHGPVLGGIFVTGTRDLKMLVGAGAAAPDGRMILRFSERLALDDNDDVAFGAHLGSGSNRSEAVMKVNTSGLTVIAAAGGAAPGGGRFAGFGEWPSAGPAGRIAFIAAIDDGPAPLGLFAWQAGTLSRLVLAGDKLPDGRALPPFALNPVTSAGTNGGVAFATMGNAEPGGGSHIYYFGPPPR